MIYAWNHMLLPSRASTSFLLGIYPELEIDFSQVSMPSRASTSFLRLVRHDEFEEVKMCVNALTGLYLISTAEQGGPWTNWERCVNALTGLYLISTPQKSKVMSLDVELGVNALTGLYLISTGYQDIS